MGFLHISISYPLGGVRIRQTCRAYGGYIYPLGSSLARAARPILLDFMNNSGALRGDIWRQYLSQHFNKKIAQSVGATVI